MYNLAQNSWSLKSTLVFVIFFHRGNLSMSLTDSFFSLLTVWDVKVDVKSIWFYAAPCLTSKWGAVNQTKPNNKWSIMLCLFTPWLVSQGRGGRGAGGQSRSPEWSVCMYPHSSGDRVSPQRCTSDRLTCRRCVSEKKKKKKKTSIPRNNNHSDALMQGFYCCQMQESEIFWVEQHHWGL